jgi:hypothetical protein
MFALELRPGSRSQFGAANGQWARTNSPYNCAMAGGSSGGRRRRMIKTPESTCGTGRNAAAGIRRPRRNSHQGAHVVERRVEAGNAARFRATSHCTMKSARSRAVRGSSSRRRRISVVCPNGRDPTTRNGRAGNETVKKSPSTIRTLSCRPRRRWRSRSAHTGSISTATTSIRR